MPVAASIALTPSSPSSLIFTVPDHRRPEIEQALRQYSSVDPADDAPRAIERIDWPRIWVKDNANALSALLRSLGIPFYKDFAAS